MMPTSGGKERSKSMRVASLGEQRVNSKKAKALRRIARGLKLPTENKYEPVGPLRRREAIKDHGRSYTAGIVRRPFALGPCERRAYKEAKALYKTPNSTLDLSNVERIDMPQEEARPFKDQVYDSINVQPSEPVFGGTRVGS
jgi:hypothetical protein